MRKVNKDINKLPRWAKIEIEKLRGDVEYYKNQVMEISGEKKANILIDRFQEKSVFLPINSVITFKLSNGNIDCQIKDNYVEIHSSDSIGKDLVIMPHCSDTIRVKLINE